MCILRVNDDDAFTPLADADLARTTMKNRPKRS
jgi:hypothetical protein